MVTYATAPRPELTRVISPQGRHPLSVAAWLSERLFCCGDCVTAAFPANVTAARLGARFSCEPSLSAIQGGSPCR
jgi:hypothetical protein